MKWIVPILSILSLLSLCAASGMAQTTRPATRPATTAPSPEQMFNKMLKPARSTERTLVPSPGPPATDKTSGAGAVAPGAPAVTVLREGTYLVDRTGRLSHSADGQQAEFIFDSDGQALRDPPVILLPNLKLMTMENAVSASRDMRFRITGMVTEYRGRNYVLLDKVVVVEEKVDPLK